MRGFRGELGEPPARAAARAGRNPSKQKRSHGSPDADSAAIAALGPGTGETTMPAAAAAETSR